MLEHIFYSPFTIQVNSQGSLCYLNFVQLLGTLELEENVEVTYIWCYWENVYNGIFFKHIA